jgi:hypothetical protein
VDDSSDCIIKGNLVKTPSSPIFDSRLVGTVSAVSDNTRHRSLRRPVITSHRKAITPPDNPTENTPPSRAISSQSPSNMPSSLPTILENSESQYIPVNDVSSLPSTSPSSTSPLSPKQIQEILQTVTKQLTTHGRITLNFYISGTGMGNCYKYGIGTTNFVQFSNRLKLDYNPALMTRVYFMVP